MKINRQNYEEFLLDFMEGNLLASEAKAVQSFLESNPDIKTEAEDLFSFQLKAEDEVTFKNKQFLKKNKDLDIEGVTTFERLSIAFLEDEISDDENTLLEQMLEYSKERQQEHHLIQKTKLTQDENIVFPDKKVLKHFVVPQRRKALYYIGSLAASVALLIGLLLFTPSKRDYQGIALYDINLATPSFRQLELVEVPFLEEKVEVGKTNLTDKELVETVDFVREKVSITSIDSWGINFLPPGKQTTEISSSEIAAISANLTDKSVHEAKVEDYVNTTLQKLGIQQPVEEKTLLAKAGSSVWQKVSKFVKKRFQVKKVEIEDGRKLYAVKAGSLEFYTNLKGRKNKKSE